MIGDFQHFLCNDLVRIIQLIANHCLNRCFRFQEQQFFQSLRRPWKKHVRIGCTSVLFSRAEVRELGFGALAFSPSNIPAIRQKSLKYPFWWWSNSAIIWWFLRCFPYTSALFGLIWYHDPCTSFSQTDKVNGMWLLGWFVLSRRCFMSTKLHQFTFQERYPNVVATLVVAPQGPQVPYLRPQVD